VGFYVPARSKRPAITVDVDGVRQPLKITTTFLLNRHALGDKAFAQQSQYLGTFGFKLVGEYLAVTDRIRQGPDSVSPQVAMQALLEQRLGQIIDSGGLDLYT